jgi:hypothetical protein
MKHRIMFAIGVALVGILSMSAEAQSSCNISYTVTNQWPGGFGASLTIKNTGTTSISSWTLAWSFANGQTVTQLWNGSDTQSGANVTVSNLSYNGSIPAGGTLTGVGFNGSWNNATNSAPTSFSLNGVTCGGGGGTSGSFSLSPSSTSLSLADGKSTTDTISIADSGSFSGNVALSVSGMPYGIAASFGTNPATSSSILTLTASSTAPAGTSTVTVTGTSGTATASATIALTVSAGTSGSFTLFPEQSSLTVSPNAGTTDTITIDDAGGFAGSVTLTASGMPSGVTASFGPNPTTSGSVLTLTAGSSATSGTSIINIQGTSTGGSSGNLSAATTVALTVAATPALQIAWTSPASGIVGSSVTILPGVGASFGASQGSSKILFGSTAATVTTWTVNSIAVQVPNVPAGSVNVSAVVNGVTSNAVPFAVTSAVPSSVTYTGNSTWFSGLGGPYGGCGVPQANLDSQNFVALNVQNDPGNYSLELSRPISSQFASDIGFFSNGLNCGRWVHITMGANCQGTNDGAQSEPFCRGGVGWVNDQFTGAQLDLVVADSCQDNNAWCRDDPYHLDQAQSALNNYVLNGKAVGNLYPSFWNNRQITWSFEPAPNYTGDINIGFLNGANAYWSAISITHLPNGIHGVNYLSNGVWTAATMDADLGDDYIILPTVAGGTQYEIQVVDVTGTLINNGRIYSFSYPASCGTSCTPALTPVTYTTSTSSTPAASN